MNWKFWIKKPKNISEPVHSLVAEIGLFENWQFHLHTTSRGDAYHVLTHKELPITLNFAIDFFNNCKWFCTEGYMSTDEKDYVGEAFTIWYFKYKQNEAAEKKAKQEAERQRIMKVLSL